MNLRARANHVAIRKFSELQRLNGLTLKSCSRCLFQIRSDFLKPAKQRRLLDVELALLRDAREPRLPIALQREPFVLFRR